MKKREADLKFIQENVSAEDFRDVKKALGRYTLDYLRMIVLGVRKKDEVLELLEKNIRIRLEQREKRIAKLKSFNYKGIGTQSKQK